MKVGFIGVGVMGNGMVKNLLKSGHNVSVYTRTAEKAREVIESGAQWRDSISDCVCDADAVITMVGYPNDVREVYLGNDGILESARPGTLVIDMTTSSPRLAEEIYLRANERKLRALDAPVSGGDTGATNGTLAIMVGGDKDAFDCAMPLFEALGKNIRLEGRAGSGQHTKLANQIAITGTIASVCEAIAYADSVGLDKELMLETISAGAAGSWQMSNNGPKILAEDYAPGFYIKHFIKDMRLALAEAEDRRQPLQVLSAVLSLYESLAEKGCENEGTQALIKAYCNKK